MPSAVFRYALNLTGKEGAWLMLGRMILLANAFLLSIFLVRTFGLAAVGTYTIANIAVTVLTLICELGLSYCLPREALSNPQRNMVVLAWVLIMTLPAVLSIGVYAWSMGSGIQEFWEIALFASGGFAFAVTNLTNILFLLDRRSPFTLIFPVCNTLGILVGVALARSLVEVALSLFLFRTLGNAVSFLTMPFARIDNRSLLRCGLHGAGYILTDLFALLSEQCGPFILSYLLTRSDLGLFGLCRQILTAADVPCWSFIQSKYPELVESRLGEARTIGSKNTRLAFIATLCLVVGSFLLAYYVFFLPQLFAMVLILAAVLPFRYNNHFFDRVIKSKGLIKVNTWLALVKLCAAIPIFYVASILYGIWGGIFALAIISIFSDLIYRNTAVKLYSQHV
jgi:O-antigen/teichoic acid export membrane protein